MNHSETKDLTILLLTPQLPYPPHQGTSLRNYHLIRGLARRHEVHLLSFQDANHPDPGGAIQRLEVLCASVTTAPAPRRTARERLRRLIIDSRPDMAHRLQSAAFDDALRSLLRARPYDVAQVEGIELAAAMPLIRNEQPACRIVFDDHNAEAELQYRAFLTDVRRPARWPLALYSLVQWRRLRRYEKWAAQSADAVTVVSHSDKLHLENLASSLEPTVIPNCIDITEYGKKLSPDVTIPKYDVVFSGKMDYRPNVDAMLWFGDAIWPHIRREKPDATWAIVGQKPHRRLEPLAKLPGVTITGFVPDVQPYLTGAGVYVMPFRMGSGTRLKLIEAMACGKAIVSTHTGAEGFPVNAGEQLLLADDPDHFAEAVLALLSDGGRREALGAAAREFAAAYDWRRIVPRLDEVYGTIVSHLPCTTPCD
ncbi:MAG TPA: glycosyltransferase [Candidatus Sulfomarinibacteraceae bacterium]|nr:glycosyltransferase [Candidatus Sulfomarinibacteraceae bacterium]